MLRKKSFLFSFKDLLCAKYPLNCPHMCKCMFHSKCVYPIVTRHLMIQNWCAAMSLNPQTGKKTCFKHSRFIIVKQENQFGECHRFRKMILMHLKYLFRYFVSSYPLKKTVLHWMWACKLIKEKCFNIDMFNWVRFCGKF